MQSLLTCSLCQLALNSQWPWHRPRHLSSREKGKHRRHHDQERFIQCSANLHFQLDSACAWAPTSELEGGQWGLEKTANACFVLWDISVVSAWTELAEFMQREAEKHYNSGKGEGASSKTGQGHSCKETQEVSHPVAPCYLYLDILSVLSERGNMTQQNLQ